MEAGCANKVPAIKKIALIIFSFINYFLEKLLHTNSK
jgi:hypothetical protein